MVAIRGDLNVGKKRFIRDFRKQDTPLRDYKYTARDAWKSLTVVDKLRPKCSSKSNFIDTLCGLTLEKSAQMLTPSTSSLKNNQYNWSKTPKDQRRASVSCSGLYQLKFRDVQSMIIYVNDITAAATDRQGMLELELRKNILGVKKAMKARRKTIQRVSPNLDSTFSDFGLQPQFHINASMGQVNHYPQTREEVRAILTRSQHDVTRPELRTTIATNHLPIIANCGTNNSPSHTMKVRMDGMDIKLIHMEAEAMIAGALSGKSLPGGHQVM